MKTIKSLLNVCILGFLVLSCEKEDKTETYINTIEVQNITSYSAECTSEISGDESFPIVARGVCWGKNEQPTLGNSFSVDDGGFGASSSKITGLNANSLYYLRAYYRSETDTVYGNQIEFSTPDYILFNPELTYGTVTDIDGNEYKTIQIGDQTWIAENLKTTRYQNGDAITHETDLYKWGHFQIQTGAYIFYDNNESNKDVHGALYNWYAASDSRNIAPEGWRVPTVEDWKKLSDYISPFQNGYYGYKLRETTSAHWSFYDPMRLASTNSTGFTAIPSGKAVSGKFMDLGAQYAYYWTGTGTQDGSSCIYLGEDIAIDFMQPNARGFSIRCIKN
ncbi:fibrobacter succinogenes major paralogous domain-containing protein [Maribellus luteus]|nr:fibrobacter succinogenes major paralogous domain-containing protein [Maribellus luteus]